MFAEWQVGEVFLTMLWFTFFFLWIYVVVTVFTDIFRSDDLSGVAKAIWSLFIIFLPYLGVFVYLIARGGKVGERKLEEAKARDMATQSYIRAVAATPTDDLTKLGDLRERGVIDDVEYEAMKQRVAAP